MSTGKKNFINIINYINKNKIPLSDEIKLNLTDLIIKWNQKNKSIDDYFEMKNNHTYLNEYMTELNEEIKILWNEYIINAMEFRTLLMAKIV